MPGRGCSGGGRRRRRRLAEAATARADESLPLAACGAPSCRWSGDGSSGRTTSGAGAGGQVWGMCGGCGVCVRWWWVGWVGWGGGWGGLRRRTRWARLVRQAHGSHTCDRPLGRARRGRPLPLLPWGESRQACCVMTPPCPVRPAPSSQATGLEGASRLAPRGPAHRRRRQRRAGRGGGGGGRGCLGRHARPAGHA